MSSTISNIDPRSTSAPAFWLLWLDECRSPWLNMAIDELLLKTAPLRSRPLLRIYGWDRPSVSIGYVQTYSAAPEQGHTVVRRPTGGGIVFHDNDLTYTLAIPANDPFCSLDRLESYHAIHRVVLSAFSEFGIHGMLAPSDAPPVDRATMQCFVTPTRYDVLAGSSKIAGSAQRRTRNGILHQGSIRPDAAKISLEQLRKALIEKFRIQFAIRFRAFHPTDDFFADATSLATEKYATAAWNRDRISPFS